MNMLSRLWTLGLLLVSSTLTAAPSSWVIKTGIGHGAGSSAVAVQTDGKFVVGCATTAGTGIVLTRYTTSGTVDTYGTSGLATLTFPAQYSKVSGLSIALQASGGNAGKAVVAGTVYDSSANQYKIFVVRFTNSGALDTVNDTGFGSSSNPRPGYRITTLGNGASASSLSLDPADILFVTGTESDSGLQKMFLVIYDSDATAAPTPVTGSPYTFPSSFNSAGRAGLPLAGYLFTGGYASGLPREDFGFKNWGTCEQTLVFTNAQSSHINAMGARSMGLIVAGGVSDGKFALAGFSPLTCALVTEYFGPIVPPGPNRQGYVTTQFPAAAQINALAIIPSGPTMNYILAAGSSGSDIALARYRAEGILDTTFGIEGTLVLPLGDQAQAESIVMNAASDGFVISGITDGQLFIAQYPLDGKTASTQGFGHVAVVDKVYGNDGTGQVNGAPFKTIAAAIAAAGATGLATATNPVLVRVEPGTYAETIDMSTMSYITIRGASQQSVILSGSGTSSIIIKMGANTRVEDLSITWSGTTAMTGVQFPSGTVSTAKIRGVAISLTTTGASSDVIGIQSQDATVTTNDIINIDSCSVYTYGNNGSYTGTSVGISLEAASTLRATNSDIYGKGGGGTTRYGARTTSASVSAQLFLTGCTVKGDSQDVSRASTSAIVRDSAKFGYVALVDQVYGSDATGTVNATTGGTGSPFATIQAAINAAAAIATITTPVLVSVQPGTYAGALTLASAPYVTVRGASQQSVIISATSGTAVIMGDNTALENVTVKLTGSGVLIGVRVIALTAALRNVTINVTQQSDNNATGLMVNDSSSATMETCTVNVYGDVDGGAVTYVLRGLWNQGILTVIDSIINVLTDHATDEHVVMGADINGETNVIGSSFSAVKQNNSGPSYVYGLYINLTNPTNVIVDCLDIIASTDGVDVCGGVAYQSSANGESIKIRANNIRGDSGLGSGYGVWYSSQFSGSFELAANSISSNGTGTLAAGIYGLNSGLGSGVISANSITASGASTTYAVYDENSSTGSIKVSASDMQSSSPAGTAIGVYNSNTSTGSCAVSATSIKASAPIAYGVQAVGGTGSNASSVSGAAIEATGTISYGAYTTSYQTQLLLPGCTVKGDTQDIYYASPATNVNSGIVRDSAKFGWVAIVDKEYGSNKTGKITNNNGTYGPGSGVGSPFATITAALDAADQINTSADQPVLVLVQPGKYDETAGLTIPAYVTLRGVSKESVIINPTASTAITMGNNTTLENLSITVSGSSGALTGIAIANTEGVARVRDVSINVTQSASANAYGINCTASAAIGTHSVEGCDIKVLSNTTSAAGSGLYGIRNYDGSIRISNTNVLTKTTLANNTHNVYGVYTQQFLAASLELVNCASIAAVKENGNAPSVWLAGLWHSSGSLKVINCGEITASGGPENIFGVSVGNSDSIALSANTVHATGTTGQMIGLYIARSTDSLTPIKISADSISATATTGVSTGIQAQNSSTGLVDVKANAITSLATAPTSSINGIYISNTGTGTISISSNAIHAESTSMPENYWVSGVEEYVELASSAGLSFVSANKISAAVAAGAAYGVNADGGKCQISGAHISGTTNGARVIKYGSSIDTQLYLPGCTVTGAGANDDIKYENGATKLISGIVRDSAKFGYVAIVDQVYGSNATGKVGSPTSGAYSPFATIQAAIDAANTYATEHGNMPILVQVQPGTYTENITLKSYVSVLGASQETVIISPTSGTVVTMQANTRLENVTISTSTGEMVGIQFGGTTATTRVIGVTVTMTGAYCIGISSNAAGGSPSSDWVNVDRCSIFLNGSTPSYGIHLGSTSSLRVMNSAISVTGGLAAYGAYTNNASANLYLSGCVVQGGSPITAPTDIRRNAGNIYLDGATVLVNTPNPSSLLGDPPKFTLWGTRTGYLTSDKTSTQTIGNTDTSLIWTSLSSPDWTYSNGVFTNKGAPGWFHITCVVQVASVSGAAGNFWVRLHAGPSALTVSEALKILDTLYGFTLVVASVSYINTDESMYISAQTSGSGITATISKAYLGISRV